MVFRQLRDTHIVTVIESFGHQSSDSDLTKVVEEGPDFFRGAVDFVGVLVEEGEKELFPPLAVAGLAGSAGPAGEVLDGPVNLGGFVDA